jgi:hypothetical protein
LIPNYCNKQETSHIEIAIETFDIMNSLSVSLGQLGVVSRVVHGQTLDAQEAAYKIVLDTIDPKSMFAMCMTHSDEFVPLMNAFVRGKIQTYMDATIRREKDREAALLATVEKNSDSDDTASISSATSTSSASSIEDMFAAYKKTYAGMSWADIDEAETAREAAEAAREAARESAEAKAAATPVQPTGSWAHCISAFPALPTSGTKAAPKAVAMPAIKATKATTPVRATNWKRDREKTVTSEDWYFKLGLYDEEHDWFLRASDESNMPIGWRRDRAGWLTSRKGSLFRHKLTNKGDDWIHQTYDEATGKWVSKPYDAYKLAMQQARKQR